MKARKWIAAATVVIAASISLVGCSSSGSTDTSATTGTLNFVNDKSGWDFKGFSKTSQKEIGISLNSSAYADQNAYQAFIKQSLRTPKAPGMFTWHTGSQLEQLVQQGLVADTSSIWKQAVADNWISPSIQDMYTYKGKQYCTPFEVDSWVMYYDKKMFAQYNLQPPTTWAQMMNDAAVLKSHGVTPFYSQGGNPWAFVWFMLIMAGTDLQTYNDLNSGKASYTDPKVVDAMNTWLDMLKKGYFTDPGSKTPAETMMKDGKLAMMPFGTWYPSALEKVGLQPGTDWGVFTIPTVNADAAGGKTPVAVETAVACATQSSAQKAMALKYMQWWMSPDAQTAWSKQQQNLPSNPKAEASNDTFRALGKQLAEPQYTTYLRYYEAAPLPILTAALNNFTGFMTNPGDPMKYLESIQSTAKQYWASNK